MRSPTCFSSFHRCDASTTVTVAGRFLRKPDFQLRDCGASAPSVFFSLNTSSSCSRQPVIVTGVEITALPEAFLAVVAFAFVYEADALAPAASSAGATTFDVIAGWVTTSGRRAASIIAAAPISTTSTTPTVRSTRTFAAFFFPRDVFLSPMIRFLTLLKSTTSSLLPPSVVAATGFPPQPSVGGPVPPRRSEGERFWALGKREQGGCPGHNCAGVAPKPF